MARKRSIAIQYVLILVLGLAIVGLMIFILSRSDLNREIDFAPDLTLTDNPLMGYAPDARNVSLCENTGLVFITLRWADWEPADNEFAVDWLEKEYNIELWKQKNKHAVIRFVCDVPSTASHFDIPEWVYYKTRSGSYYNTEMGKGYCPDYADEVFRRYHRRAIEKLAEYCNKDHFVAFVELGSLGHWGEWHAMGAGGKNLMPDQEICFEYATLYSESFTNARLLMRRNYDFAVNGNMGFFNDMVGEPSDTAEWMDWLKNGGSQETSQRPLDLEPLSKFGVKEPIGGEITSAVPMDDVMKENLGQTLADVTASNMTFIGPMVPDYNNLDYRQATESLLRRMGYRIYVSKLKTQYEFSDNTLNLELTFKNAGNAGFYFDWPVTVHVLDKNKNELFWEGLDIDLRDLNTKGEAVGYSAVPVNNDIREEFYIGVSITDYTGEEKLKLAIDSDDEIEWVDEIQLIYHNKQ
ncbi:MAG: DUF4832 domain-containing protein [Lachnospiraceae bacterium]|nr:DUF4832 domain-containing protein [Lachnospiraceae bacterium]